LTSRVYQSRGRFGVISSTVADNRNPKTMARHNPKLALNNYGWTISVSNFPPEAPSPTRRMSVQFVLNDSSFPMRSDDHGSIPYQFTGSSELVTNESSNVIDGMNVDVDTRSPTPVSLVPTRSPKSPNTKPQFKRSRKRTLPKSSAPQDEDWIYCLRTRSQYKTILGPCENTQSQKHRIEQEEPRKRRARVLDVEKPKAPQQEEDKSTYISSKAPLKSQSTTEPSPRKQTASRVCEKPDIDPRYDRSALTYQDGEYWTPRACF